MFSKDAHFICRKCLRQFVVPDKLSIVVMETSDLTCPNCGLECHNTNLLNIFFGFYPRLVNMIKFLEVEGFLLVGWKADKNNTLGSKNQHRILSLSFICQTCGKTHIIPIEIAAGGFSWTCKKCGLKPQKMVNEEFMASFHAVHNSQYILGRHWFQLDIFSPIGKDPIQSIPPIQDYQARE